VFRPRVHFRECVVMRSTFRRFVADESGATAIEYAIIAGVIALGIVVSMGAIRNGLNDILNNVSDNLK